MTSNTSIAFEDIYNDLADAVFRHCFFRVGDREEALDLTAEAFGKLWAQMSVGKEIESPKAYLFAIARNLIIDWYRKKKPESLNALLEGSEFEAPFEIADQNIKEVEAMHDAKEALSALSQVSLSYREVLYLRFIDGLEPREIAQVLSVSPNAVSIRVGRGLEELRHILKIENKK